MKRHIITLSLVLLASCTADLRNNRIKQEGITLKSRQKAIALLDEMIEAHGGSSNWKKVNAFKVILKDYWPKWMMRTFGMPWEFSGQKLKLEWKQGTDNSKLTFLDGKMKNQIWGIQNWSPYVKRHKNIEFEKNNKIKFWLPTLQYFIEAMFRVKNATILGYMGEKVVYLDNKKVKFDLIFASWKTDKPQSNIDQYVIWINKITKQMQYLQYTVRDMMRFMKGTMHYKKFKMVGGILLAKRMTVIGNPGDEKNITHDIQIDSINLSEKYLDKYFLPNPKISHRKN